VLDEKAVVVDRKKHIVAQKKLCHTPFFDQFFLFLPVSLKPGIFVVSDEILVERYFKIPHFLVPKSTVLSFIII